MRLALIISLAVTTLMSGWDFKGYSGIEYKLNSSNRSEKQSSNRALSAQLQSSFTAGAWEFKTSIEALKDSRDNERKYLLLNELYFLQSFESYEITVGKQIRFWGSLEAFNITDILNPQLLIRDLYDKEYKIGVWLGSFAYYFEDDSSLEFLVKLRSEEQKIQRDDSLEKSFSLPYNSTLATQKKPNRQSWYLKYSSSTQNDMQLDYSFGISQGYDNNRLFRFNNGSIEQYAYQSWQYFTYDTLLVNSTLYKLEALYSDVEKNHNILISDSLHFAFGLEHTFAQTKSGTESSLIVEHYRYKQINHKNYNALLPYIVMNNDLFLGVRALLNDAASSEIVGGAIFDLSGNSEKQYYLQFERRVFESFKLEADLRYTAPSRNEHTILKDIGEHGRISVNTKYYF